MALTVAEAVYPGYSPRDNWISDLGATCSYAGDYRPHDCVYVQPASAIFMIGAVSLGTLLLASAYLLHPLAASRRLPIFLGLAGAGGVGVGLVSEEFAPFHSIFASLMFLTGGLAAVESSRFLPRLLGHVSLILAAIVFAASGIVLTVGGGIGPPSWTPLGLGGMERLIAYPQLLWVVLFGATIAARPVTLEMPTVTRRIAKVGRRTQET